MRWLDRRHRALALLLAIWIGALLLHDAVRRDFWHDEVYTVLLAGLSLPDLWRAGLDGVDLSPPLHTAVVHAVQSLFGAGPVVTRLPAMAGFLAAAGLVFAMVRRRANAAAATSAVLALASTSALDFATQARGYGLTLGLFALVLFCWSEAAAGVNVRRHRILLGCALAAGVWTHWFFVFAALPVAVGELVRQLARRRIDIAAWATLAAAGLATLPLAALARTSTSQRDAFWARPSATGAIEVYRWLPADFGLSHAWIAVLLSVAFFEAMRRRRGAPGRAWPPLHEAAAGVVCLALPAMAALFGAALGVFDPRYALFSCAGLATAVPVAAWCAMPRNGLGDAMLLGGFLVVAGLATAKSWQAPPWWKDLHARRPVLGQALRGDGPVVIDGGADYLPLWYYASADTRDRALYLADPDAQRRATGSDTVDLGYLALARWFPVPVVAMETALQERPAFRLYATGNGWTRGELGRRGASLREVAREADGGGVLWSVTMPSGKDTR
jgi:hypothetical protein